MKTKLLLCYILTLSSLYSCKKTFLDAKPSTDLLVPKTFEDFRSLLDNTTALNYTSALGQMASDEYIFVDYASWQSTFTSTERNSYIWAKDIYEGETDRLDWNRPYISIFYANNVIQGLQNLHPVPIAEYNQIKGWALFIRAFSFYDLARTFCKVYDPQTSNTDPGIPLRLSPNIDELLPRASVQQTYDQVLEDLKLSCTLLTSDFQLVNRNRPSKGAAYALLARIYLSMNKYKEAELYADSSLVLYNKLMDYNTISTSNATPFTISNDETLFSTSQISAYGITINGTSNTAVTVNPDLINSYSDNDLRLSIYFAKNTRGNYYVKRGYLGSGNYPFSGIATDEIYLIKSECLARRNEITQALDLLNDLLVMRHKNTVPYTSITAISKEDAINKILLERRKELVWRGLRWSDLKRLNKIGAGITLKRSLNNVKYTLPPNDPRYVLPIPDDEITRSQIEQNNR